MPHFVKVLTLLVMLFRVVFVIVSTRIKSCSSCLIVFLLSFKFLLSFSIIVFKFVKEAFELLVKFYEPKQFFDKYFFFLFNFFNLQRGWRFEPKTSWLSSTYN